MINNTVEYILCSAIHFNNDAVDRKEISGIKTGLLICGRRHSDIFNTMFNIYNGDIDRFKKDYPIDKVVQGFLTSNNRFVDRKEAFLIAKKSGV